MGNFRLTWELILLLVYDFPIFVNLLCVKKEEETLLIHFDFVLSVSVSVPLNLRMTRKGATSGNRAVSIRSEQSTEGSNGLDIWLGRGAMVGFAVAITVEIATGKGLLEVTSNLRIWLMYTK